MTDTPKESIVNASIPSAGRIYDYMLGGHHNFEVDRQAAEAIFRHFMPLLARWFGFSVGVFRILHQELTEQRGLNTIIDFASGLADPGPSSSRGTRRYYRDLLRLRSCGGGVR